MITAGKGNSGSRNNLAASQHAFSLQYTSLVLIVLAFVIGAFTRPAEIPESASVELPEVLQIGEMSYMDLFLPGTAEINASKLSALQEFLENHDVSLSVEVYPEPRTASDSLAQDPVALTLARSVGLYRELISRNVPAPAVEVLAVNLASDNQASMKIFRKRGY